MALCAAYTSHFRIIDLMNIMHAFSDMFKKKKKPQQHCYVLLHVFFPWYAGWR